MAGRGLRFTPLLVSSLSAIFAALALVATTITTWVSWNARDDFLESVALSEAVERCATAVTTLDDYHRTLSSLAADFGTNANAARSSAALLRATEFSDSLADDLVRLELAHLMRFPDEPSPFTELKQRLFDLYTEFTGTILVSNDATTLAAALDPVLTRIAATGPDLYGLCAALASRR